MRTTLPEIYWPLMDAQAVMLDRCAVCGRNWPLEQHHIVWRSWGELFVGGEKAAKPTVTLCGFGNNLRDSNGIEYCHGLAHHRRLHFRNDRGLLEYIVLDQPTRYQAALGMDGWVPLDTEEEWT